MIFLSKESAANIFGLTVYITERSLVFKGNFCQGAVKHGCGNWYISTLIYVWCA